MSIFSWKTNLFRTLNPDLEQNRKQNQDILKPDYALSEEKYWTTSESTMNRGCAWVYDFSKSPAVAIGTGNEKNDTMFVRAIRRVPK